MGVLRLMTLPFEISLTCERTFPRVFSPYTAFCYVYSYSKLSWNLLARQRHPTDNEMDILYALLLETVTRDLRIKTDVVQTVFNSPASPIVPSTVRRGQDFTTKLSSLEVLGSEGLS